MNGNVNFVIYTIMSLITANMMLTFLTSVKTLSFQLEPENHFINPLTSRPGCIPGSRYTGVGVLFFVI